MRSEVLLVATRKRLPRIECRGAIQARRTDPDTVHLVSAAATPLGGDTIEITVIVDEGARLRLRSAAATVALPGTDCQTSHARWQMDVTGTLDVDLEPTVVAAGARHLSSVVLRLHHHASVRLRERVQIGRCNERDGFWSQTMRADRDDRPLLRHRVELGARSLADDAISAPRAMVSELRYPTDTFTADHPACAETTVLALAGGGTLSTRLADRLAG